MTAAIENSADLAAMVIISKTLLVSITGPALAALFILVYRVTGPAIAAALTTASDSMAKP